MRRYRRTLVVAAAVNALLIALVVWSRPGSTTTVRVVASGNTFRAYVDGKLEQTAASAAEPRGGIGFGLPPGDAVPSYPGPSAVRSIRVTDTASGRVLLDDSFDRRTVLWHRDSAWVQRGGATWTRTGGIAVTGYRPWRDYVVEARLANVESADILVRTQDNGDAIDFSFRPFREFDSAFLLRRGRDLRLIAPVGTTETDTLETTRSIVAIALRGYRSLALALLAGVSAFALALALALGTRLSVLSRLSAAVARFARPLAVMVALAAGASLLAINWILVRRMPHVPDEVGYLFQAKVFASFHLYGHVPRLADAFAFPGTIIQDRGRWFSQYPFGHPLFLAFGELVHAPWLVPPIVGALTVYCVFRLGEHLYGPLTGLLAAVLLFASPFFQMTASNFMSHNSGSLCLVAATLFFVRPGSRPRAAWLASGLLLGLLFNIRPLTAAGVSVPFVIWAAIEWRRAVDRRSFAQQAACLAAGAGLMFGAYLLYNLELTGSALKSPYAYWNSGTVGFSAAHSFAQGLMNTQTNLSLLVLVLHGWPVYVGLLLPLLPFVLGTTNRWDYFLLAAALSIIAAWSAYRGVFIMHGPRFWYEFVPYLMLLAARGVQRFVETLAAAGERLASRFPGRSIDVRSSAGLVAAFCLVALLGCSFGGWVLGRRDLFPPMAYVPRHIGELRGFNSTDPRLLRAAEAEGLHHSVVFVRECGNWWCYGSVFWTNSLKVDGDVVWARDLGRESDVRLMSSYHGRRAYIADYDRGSVVPLSLPGSSLSARR